MYCLKILSPPPLFFFKEFLYSHWAVRILGCFSCPSVCSQQAIVTQAQGKTINSGDRGGAWGSIWRTPECPFHSLLTLCSFPADLQPGLNLAALVKFSITSKTCQITYTTCQKAWGVLDFLTILEQPLVGEKKSINPGEALPGLPGYLLQKLQWCWFHYLATACLPVMPAKGCTELWKNGTAPKAANAINMRKMKWALVHNDDHIALTYTRLHRCGLYAHCHKK